MSKLTAVKLTRINGVSCDRHTGLATTYDGKQYWVFRGNPVSLSGFCQLTGLNNKQKTRLTLNYGVY